MEFPKASTAWYPNLSDFAPEQIKTSRQHCSELRRTQVVGILEAVCFLFEFSKFQSRKKHISTLPTELSEEQKRRKAERRDKSRKIHLRV